MNYGQDSFNLMVEIKLYEYGMAAFDRGDTPTEEGFHAYMLDFNFGRELLNRKLIKWIFGGGEKGTNLRIRKSLVQTMLKVDKFYPNMKDSKFDNALKEHMRLVCEN